MNWAVTDQLFIIKITINMAFKVHLLGCSSVKPSFKFISRRHCDSSYIMHYSRLQNGACGENTAKFASTCVQVVVASPINSKPELQV